MRSVGVRELRQRASEYLRLVEAGETFEVTDRGRPVARLTPVPDASPIEQLRATGDVSEDHRHHRGSSRAAGGPAGGRIAGAGARAAAGP